MLQYSFSTALRDRSETSRAKRCSESMSCRMVKTVFFGGFDWAFVGIRLENDARPMPPLSRLIFERPHPNRPTFQNSPSAPVNCPSYYNLLLSKATPDERSTPDVNGPTNSLKQTRYHRSLIRTPDAWKKCFLLNTGTLSRFSDCLVIRRIYTVTFSSFRAFI